MKFKRKVRASAVMATAPRPKSAPARHNEEVSSRISVRMKMLLALTAAGVCASTLVPAAAQASTGQFTFCNVSNAPEYVAFPFHGWMSSTVQNPWQCTTISLDSHGRTWDQAEAFQYFNGRWTPDITMEFDPNQHTYWYV